MNELKNERMAVERWKKAVKAGSCQASYRRKRGYTQTNDDYFVDGVQWADENHVRVNTFTSADGEENLDSCP